MDTLVSVLLAGWRTAKRTVTRRGNANLIRVSPRASEIHPHGPRGIILPRRYIILIYGALNTILPIAVSLSSRRRWDREKSSASRRIYAVAARVRGEFSYEISGYRDEREIRWCRNKCKDRRKTQ